MNSTISPSIAPSTTRHFASRDFGLWHRINGFFGRNKGPKVLVVHQSISADLESKMLEICDLFAVAPHRFVGSRPHLVDWRYATKIAADPLRGCGCICAHLSGEEESGSYCYGKWPTQAEKDAELARLSGLHHFWTEKLSELSPEKLVSECIMRAVCRDADLVKLDRLTSELAAAKAELEIRTRQRDYWMDDRTKHKARADAAEKQVAAWRDWEDRAKEIIGQLMAHVAWLKRGEEGGQRENFNLLKKAGDVLTTRPPPADTQTAKE